MSSEVSLIYQLPFEIFSSCEKHCSVPILLITIITLILLAVLIFFWAINARLRSIQSSIILNLIISSSIQLITLQFVPITHYLYEELLLWSILSQSIVVTIISFLSYIIASQNILFKSYSALFPICLFLLGNFPPLVLSLLNKFLLHNTITMSIICMSVLSINVIISLGLFLKIIIIKYKDSWIKSYVKKSVIFLYIEIIFCLFSIIVSFKSIGENKVIVIIYLSFFSCKGILFSITFFFFPTMLRAIKRIFCKAKSKTEELDDEMMKSLTMTMTRLL